MLENQSESTPAKKESNTPWTALAIGGGCALLACLGLVVVLAATVVSPKINGIFNQINFGLANTAQSPLIDTATPESQLLPNVNANTMGDPNAPVKMIEYADFQCPYCRHYWQQTEPQIIQTYVAAGKVYYEYRSVGAFTGPESAAAAEAAYCAGDQGKFWEYHDVLYSNWTGENVGDFAADKLRAYAKAVGLDQRTFDDCLSNGAHRAQVQQDVVDAKADGIRATPSFLINGKLIEGAQSFDAFQQEIEAVLQGK